jgi:hypothetical protein
MVRATRFFQNGLRPHRLSTGVRCTKIRAGQQRAPFPNPTLPHVAAYSQSHTCQRPPSDSSDLSPSPPQPLPSSRPPSSTSRPTNSLRPVQTAAAAAPSSPLLPAPPRSISSSLLFLLLLPDLDAVAAALPPICSSRCAVPPYPLLH